MDIIIYIIPRVIIFYLVGIIYNFILKKLQKSKTECVIYVLSSTSSYE